jgi:predicted metalloprotease
MRLDELPRSDRVEDRRGVTAGRAGIGIGTVVVLGLVGWAFGIDPRLLIGGAEMLSRVGQTQQQQVPTGAPSDELVGQIRLGCPRQHRRSLDRSFCSSRENL